MDTPPPPTKPATSFGEKEIHRVLGKVPRTKKYIFDNKEPIGIFGCYRILNSNANIYVGNGAAKWYQKKVGHPSKS